MVQGLLQSAQKRSIAYFLALAGVIIVWGASFVVVDLAEKYVTPLSIATWRWLIASALFLVLTPLAKKNRAWDGGSDLISNPRVQKQYWSLLVILSILGVSAYFPAQYTAIFLIGPSIPALLTCLVSPVLIAITSALTHKEQISRTQIFGFIAAIFGALLIITGGNFTQIVPTSTNFMGNFLTILTPFLWASYSILSKKAMDYGNSLQIMRSVSCLGALGLMIVEIVSGDITSWSAALFQPEVIIAILYLAIGCSVFGYFVWNIALSQLPSASVGAFLYAEPFVTTIIAWIFLQQFIPLLSILGAGIVIIGLVLITKTIQQIKK